MTLSPKGSLETRRGVANFNTTATSQEGSIGGMRYYDTSQNEDLVTVTQGRLYSINSNGSATVGVDAIKPALCYGYKILIL